MDKLLKFDDMDDSPLAERLIFAVNGAEYAIDLAPANRALFDQALAPFIAAAVVDTRSARQEKRKRVGPVRAVGDGPSPADVRQWAGREGIPCALKGKVPQSVVDQYLAAQSPVVHNSVVDVNAKPDVS